MTFHAPSGKPPALFLESAAIQLGKQTLASSASCRRVLAKNMICVTPVLLAELNLDLLLARRNPAKSFKPLPAYPASAGMWR